MTDLPASGRFDGRIFRLPIRVYFEDTDLSGIVYHANYLRYMERARSEMLAAAGIDQRAAFDRGGGVYAVADLAIRYLAPARLSDALIVASTVRHVSAATATLVQRIYRDGTLLTDATVRAAFLTVDGRPRRQPTAWRDAFAALIEDDA